MIGRFWRWLIGNQKIEVNIKLQIEDLQKLENIIEKTASRQVIIDGEKKKESYTSTENTKNKKKLKDDPATADEVAKIMLSDGIQKAVDKTGNDVISASEGNSTDDTVSSLKTFLRRKEKDA